MASDTPDAIADDARPADPGPVVATPPAKPAPRRRKRLRLALIACLLLILLGFAGFSILDGYLRSLIATQSTKSLGLTCDLESASLAPLGGHLKLHGFRIHSPPGFSPEPLLDVQSGDIVMAYRELGKQPCRVDLIVMDRPRLLVEIVGGRLNTKVMTDNIPPVDPNTERLRLNIGKITINDPVVVLRPGFKHLPAEIVIPVESFSIENVGAVDGSDKGAPVKDVTKQLVRALITQAKKSPAMPPDIRGVLDGDLSAIATTLIPGKAGEALGAVLSPGRLTNPTTGMFSMFGGKPKPTSRRTSETGHAVENPK